MRRLSLAIKLLLALVALLALGAVAAHGAPAVPPQSADPALSIPLPGNNQDPGTNLSILGLFTLITIGPSLLIMMTGFTRILIVLGFLRNALGTPSIPPNQVLVGFSLFLTIFVMGPTFTVMNEKALQPYLDGQLDAKAAIEEAEKPLRDVHAEADGHLGAGDVREAVAAAAPRDRRRPESDDARARRS